MEYVRRVVDDDLDELLPHLPAVALEGAKGVGKTSTAQQRAATVLRLLDPGQRQTIAADPTVIRHLPKPLLLDEWQLEPALWNHVREAVDEDPSGNQFLLTGSAGPTRGIRMHSGAGRVVRMVLRPMILSERHRISPTVSLKDLLKGDAVVEGQTSLSLSDYVDEILCSGFPAFQGLPERAVRIQLESYLARAVDHDLPEGGFLFRRPAALRAWLTAYAAATSTTTSYSRILDAATPGEDEKPSRNTVTSYREALERLFLLDPLPAWVPSLSPLKRLVAAPKHHLVDPALAAHLIGATKDSLLYGPESTFLGALFESLATLCVRVMAQSAEATTGHLRTKGGEHEIDLMVEGRDRRVVGVEVKLASIITDRDVRHLHWLKQELGERVTDLVVLTTGPHAFRRADGIAVVPLGLLAP